MDASAQLGGLVGEIFALCQTGLHFSRDRYDRERYARLLEIAVQLGEMAGLMDRQALQALSTQDVGYCTPKVDVRAALFVREQVLLIPEEFDEGKWTLPGGWADTNETASEAVSREVWEEARVHCSVRKLAAVLDRSKHPHQPPMISRVYKLIFVCDFVGDPAAVVKAGPARFFPLSDLPPLSIDRILPDQIARAYEHSLDATLLTDFD